MSIWTERRRSSLGSAICAWIVGSACLVGLLIHAGPAWATRPGFNGKIAYVQDKAIYVDGVQVSQPPEGAFDRGPAWSPDGRQIAFVRNELAIYAMNADGSNLRNLVTSVYPVQLGAPSGRLSALGWTGNGQKVTFLSSEGLAGLPYDGFYARWSVYADLPHLVGGPDAWYSNAPQLDSTEPLGPTRDQGYLDEDVFVRRDDPAQIWLGDGGYRVIDLTDDLPASLEPGVPLPKARSPQFQPTKIADRPRIMFVAQVYPDGGSVPRREVYSINPLYRINPQTGIQDQGHDVRRLTVADLIECGEAGATYTRASADYYTPVPSPDGQEFLAVRRSGCSEVKELYRFDRNGVEIEQIGSGASQPAWQPKHAQFAVRVVTKRDDPLEGAEVELRPDSDAGGGPPSSPTDTAPGGAYRVGGVLPGDYRVRVTLRNPAFDVRHEYTSDSPPVWVEKKVTVDGEPGQRVDFVFDGTGAVESSLGNGGPVARLSDMAFIFRNLHEFVGWFKANITPSTGNSVPFYTFATTSPAATVEAFDAFYLRDPGAVFMGILESGRVRSSDTTRKGNAPENSEWHEYVHHFYSFPCPGQRNHFGYPNESTCDSMKEGVATFLAAWANHGHESMYAGIEDLEAQAQKPWSFRYIGGPEFNRYTGSEDLAVAALLWDIVDTEADFEYTPVITDAISPGSALHLPATYADTVSVPVQTLWGILQSSSPTVYALRLALDALPEFSERTVDLDHDGVMDVSAVDQVFLMHGFFPIHTDQEITAVHNTYHYDVNGPGITGIFGPRNDSVGLSSHLFFIYDAFYLGYDQVPRFALPVAPDANLRIDVRDASGTPLRDADIEFSVVYPGLTRTFEQRLDDGAGALVPFELPSYFDYIPSGSTLPPCDAATDVHVSVTARATVNGYGSANTSTFDNCQYLQALVASSGGGSALSIAFDFPEDSTSPAATRVASPFLGQPYVQRPNILTGGAWIVTLTCDDPVVGGFASGCMPVEYRLDAGSWKKYDDEFDVREPGLHTLEVRAQDRAGNVAALDAVELGIFPVLDQVPPVTTLTALPSVPPVDGYTAGAWRVTLECVDHGSRYSNGTEATAAGCATTEYRVDGGAFRAYGGLFEVGGPGDHVVEYRSIDRLDNAETAQSNVLRIAGPDTTPPFTQVDVAFDAGAYAYDDGASVGAMSSGMTFSLTICSDGNGGPAQIQSGCATTEYALDGGSFAPLDAPVVVTQPGPHTFRWRSTDVVGNVEDIQSMALTLLAPVDQDGDTIVDWYDNCLTLPNPDQRNSEGDLFGDLCDPDYNGNGRVDSRDASLMKHMLGSSGPGISYLDLSDDGVVDAQDMAILKARFGKSPGPAGHAVLFNGGF